MKRVRKLNMIRLTNSGHYDFMGIYLRDKIAEAPEVIKTALAPVMSEFNAAVSNEYAWLEWTRASVLTNKIKEADVKLDRTLRAIKLQISASALSIHPDIVEAALRLKLIIDSYGYLPKMKYEEEIAGATAVLGHLKTDRNADAQKAGLKSWIPILEEAIKEFNAVYNLRNDERSAKPDGTFRSTRRRVDEAYYLIVAALELGAVGTDPVPFITFINKLNEEIDRINAHYAPPARLDMALCAPDRIPDQVETGDQLTPCIPAVYYPFDEERLDVRIEERPVDHPETDRSKTDERDVIRQRESAKLEERGVITRMERLVLGRDYNLTYRNNIKPGTGIAVIHGKGRFKGRYEEAFTILPYGYIPIGEEGECSCGCCSRCVERAKQI